jgi:primosomal protein N'
MRIADVAPFRRMPHTINCLSYLITEELEPRIVRGSLVEVGIRGAKTAAVVLRVYEAESSPHRLQPIARIIGITLPESCITALELAARYFAVTVPYLADALLPTPPKRWKESVALTDCATTPWDGEYLLIEPDSAAQDLDAVLALIRETVARGFTAHILVPNFERANHIAAKLPTTMRVATASSELAAGALFTVFAQALKGELDVLITTRRGVLFPIAKLGRIIIIDEENSDHKQWDMKPRYDARTMAIMIAGAAKAGVVAHSLTPRLTTRAMFKAQASLPTIPRVVIHTNADTKNPMSQPTLDAIEDAEDACKQTYIIDYAKYELLDYTKIAAADLVIAVHPDRMLSATEWSAEERLHAHMLRIVKHMKSTATLIVVSMSPHRAFAGLLPTRRDEYYTKLLDERREHEYPPYGAFVKLIIQSEVSAADAMKRAEALFDQIRVPGVEFLGPYPSVPPVVRGKHRVLALLQGAPDAIADTKPKLNDLHDDILVDIDPDRIFR